MDIVDAALWIIAGASFVFVAFGCWMTRPANALAAYMSHFSRVND